MKKFALIGTPISHSLSPTLFRAAYKNADFEYSLLETDEVFSVGKKLRNGELQGINITAPLKIKALSIADEQSDAVKIIGATNTIVHQPDGKLKAYNADYYGVFSTFKELNIEVENKNCIVLGAGGASMAAVYAMKKLNARVTIANRTVEKARAYAEKLNCALVGLDKLSEIIKYNSIIINTLPPKVDVVDESLLNKNQTIFDASYIGSPLKDKAIRLGIKYLDGRYWLMYQACACFKLFTGLQPDVAAMQKVLNL